MKTVMPTRPEELADPHRFFRRLREESPVAWDDEHGMWLISTYAEAVEVLSNTKVFSSHAGHMSELGAPLILTEDPPAHTRLRRMVSHAFTPRRISDWGPRVQEITDQLIEAMRHSDGTVDLVSSLSSPLPVVVIAEMIGIDPNDRERIWKWSYDFLASMERGAGWRDAIRPTLEQLRDYFHGVIELRRTDPRDDLISTLLVESPRGERLDEDELFMMCEILMVAGNETTTNLISNAIVAMKRWPEQYERLKAEPSLAADWVEETLRWEPSVRVPNDRKALEDYEIAGKRIRRGDRVLVLTASANRDASVFESPDDFILGQSPNKHLAFGHGVHLCLGAPLARLEATTAIRSFVEAFPHFEIDDEHPPVRADLMHTNGYESLHLRLHPGQQA